MAPTSPGPLTGWQKPSRILTRPIAWGRRERLSCWAMMQGVPDVTRSPDPHFVRLATIEYFAAAAVFGWGLWLLVWGSDSAISSAAFAYLRASVEGWGFGPAWRVLGLLGMASGVLYAIAVKINGAGMMWTPIVRGTTCVGAVIFYANLVYSIMQVQPSSTGVYSYATISVFYACLFVANLDRFAVSLVLIWERLRGLDT